MWTTSSSNPIHPDLRDVVYVTGVREGDDKDWQFLWSKLQTESVESEKSKLFEALGSSKDANLLEKYLEETLTLSNVRLQDVAQVFRAVGNNPQGRQVQFKWLLTHWNKVQMAFKERFPEYVLSMVRKKFSILPSIV